MALLYEVQTIWNGVEGAPYYTTLRGVFGSSTTAQEMADAWETFLGGLVAVTNDQLNAVISDEVRIIESTTGETQQVDTIVGSTTSMTAGGDPLPTLVQLLLRWSTPSFTAGRRIRGRTFIPGQLEANNDASGKPSAGLRSGIEANAATFIAACGGNLVVYSPTHRAYATVSEASCGTEWSFLRSRRD